MAAEVANLVVFENSSVYTSYCIRMVYKNSKDIFKR